MLTGAPGEEAFTLNLAGSIRLQQQRDATGDNAIVKISTPSKLGTPVSCLFFAEITAVRLSNQISSISAHIVRKSVSFRASSFIFLAPPKSKANFSHSRASWWFSSRQA